MWSSTSKTLTTSWGGRSSQARGNNKLVRTCAARRILPSLPSFCVSDTHTCNAKLLLTPLRQKGTNGYGRFFTRTQSEKSTEYSRLFTAIFGWTFFSSKDIWSKAITSPTHITSLHLLMTVLSLLSSFFFSLLLSKTTAGEQEAWFAGGKINAI